jgi:glycosyltransferase involved in cell wall biosynthesis
MRALQAKSNMSITRLRIVLVAPLPPPYGGIGNWTVLLRRFAQVRNDISLDIVDTAPRWRAIDDLVVWKRFLGGGAQLLRDYLRFLVLLWKRPDIVHLTTSGQLASVRDIAILTTAWLIRSPSVYHIRFGRIPEIAQKNTREWRMLAKAMRMASAVIAIDHETAATIARLLPGVPVVRIPNGIDLAGLPQSVSSLACRTLTFLGWVIPTKGVAELCQAWAQSQSSLTGWRCLVVGPGAEGYRQELRSRFGAEHLEFLPQQSHADAMRLMAATDVFVLPSYTEGFPNVIIEAMAMGKSIIASNVGAIPEMLSGGCGVVVPPKDVDALVKALREVCSDAEMRKAMGARAQVKARTEYAMDRVLEQLMSVWRDVAKKPL